MVLQIFYTVMVKFP